MVFLLKAFALISTVVVGRSNTTWLRASSRLAACETSVVKEFSKFALVTKNNAVIKGNADKPVAVGGELSTVEDWNQVTVAGTSYVGSLHATNNKITFAEGLAADGFPFDWEEVEALASKIAPSTNVHVIEQQADQVFDNFDFLDASDEHSKSNRNDGQTLVVFTGTEDVRISPVWGRCFGPSIIAPFARVLASDWCSVEGYIIAESYDANGIGQNLRGEGYGQELLCDREKTIAPTASPAPSVAPVSAPTPSPTASPTGCDLSFDDALVAHVPLSRADIAGCDVVGGTPVADRLGVTPGALYFGGSGYVECPEHMALDGNSSRSYCAWARAGVSNRFWNGLLRTGAEGECTLFDLRYRPELGRLRLDGSRGSGSTSACKSIFRSVSVPDPYDWHFFCVTYDGADVVVYVDGALFARSEGVALDTSTQNPLLIGRRWTGSISDVTIFSGNLAEKHVAQLYAGVCEVPAAPSLRPTAVPAAAPTPSPTVPPSTRGPTSTSEPTPSPPAKKNPVAAYGALKVEGSKIVSVKTGEPAQLRGMSLFWSNDGWGGEKFYDRGVVETLATEFERANLVRAAMGTDPEHSGSYYYSPASNRAKVETVVEAAIEFGMYVVIDWHSHDAQARTAAAADFFRDMAQKYGGFPNVIFEVYNEPDPQGDQGDDWPSIKAYAIEVIAAIRAYSSNLVVVGTPNWSQEVGAAAGSPIDDPNVAYAFHFYAAAHKEGLRSAIAEHATTIPLFCTEWGSVWYTGDGDVDEESTLEWIAWMDSHSISWANWALNDKNEGASFLKPGVSTTTGPWDTSDLTPSGLLVRSLLS
ncbi:hypothetical protein CTAYLR_007419 [Chrysophaeum taylorii]|uniref:Glycoside hydrolase family 5 domain-containing protein n=1 Tax=Chrysophaeum taylorii TaxID=2483200 RepID=A0AAD7U6U3_9STRA|nr:hypothetical protein CTAYLR_007419 [Chrysophaeum taylorii]